MHSTGGKAVETRRGRETEITFPPLSLCLSKLSLYSNILVLLYFSLATGLVAVLLNPACLFECLKSLALALEPLC